MAPWKCNVLSVLALLMLLGWSPAALADLVVEGQQKTIASPAALPVAENIEFFLDLIGAQDGGSITTSGWQIRVGLTGPDAGTDVAITGISNTMDHSQAGTGLGAADLATTTEAFRAAAAVVDFNVNDQEGFMRVNLLVQPATVGDYTLSILTGPLDTAIAQPGGAGGYDFATIHGSLTVIPEPSAFLCLLVPLLGIAAAQRLTKKWWPRGLRCVHA